MDALIQMSEVFRMSEDMQTAADLIGETDLTRFWLYKWYTKTENDMTVGVSTANNKISDKHNCLIIWIYFINFLLIYLLCLSIYLYFHVELTWAESSLSFSDRLFSVNVSVLSGCKIFTFSSSSVLIYYEEN